MNPFIVSNEKSLEAYEIALKNFSKHAKDKIEAFKNEEKGNIKHEKIHHAEGN